jgi:hypothetical protein
MESIHGSDSRAGMTKVTSLGGQTAAINGVTPNSSWFLWSDDHPNSALRAGDVRAHNAIRQTEEL